METKIETPSDILDVPAVKVACKKCGELVEHPFPSLAKYGILCNGCADENNRMTLADAVARSQIIDVSGWERICPVAFQHTEAHKLPSPTKLQRVLAWTYGEKGLLLHGPTGLGKTRCLYELLKREFKASRTVSVLDHSSAYKYSQAYDEGPSAAGAWLDHKCKVDILAMDDIFKARLTDSFEQAIFTIISQRTERGLPVLLTTNDVGSTLEGRMSKDRGPALVRRLREFCEIVSFQ
jgi:hypothetical protein